MNKITYKQLKRLALLNSVKLARDCGFRHMEFESDSEHLVGMLKSKENRNRSYMGLIIREIISLMSHFDLCVFRRTHRLGNSVAHCLAQLAHSEPNRVWIEEVPVQIQSLYSI